MDKPTHPIRPTDLATAMKWSVPYASQVLNGHRGPSIGTALAIYERTKVKLGPLANASEADIAVLRKVAA